ncbi:hypothetical protein [uncultured Tenacibaculum sp.]|uniref:hypothetical protein n=1 Tax=uncultured Tenacibaculum sp. TaxID=174713 RepID=UPI0026186670|nr:hypothetical protein [uncultured Tenacibaculum sp.]
MKKSILDLGKTLDKSEQKNVFGGIDITITAECGFVGIGKPYKKCPPGAACISGKCRYVLL